LPVPPTFSPSVATEIWDHVLEVVRRRVGQQCLDTWFRPIVFEGHDESVVHLTVPSDSFRAWLLENYADLLREAVREAAKSPLEIDVAVQRSSKPAAAEAPRRTVHSGSVEADDAEGSDHRWNSKYTFDSFIVGASNQFARAAALAVAEQPSKAYNPLYIYGGVGLGKTHLMHAIGQAIAQKNRRLRLTYMSSEKFMNELVNSIRYDRTSKFRQKYRTMDVLLMDDIQFLAGKESTQTEFFHTVNALYDEQKQIVITSDCAPRAIPTLEERLHSRFEWGLIADIQPPDLETKVAILKKKAGSERMALSDGVAMYIASNIRSSIRELEGALNRVIARSSLDGIDAADLDVAYAQDVLRDVVGDGKHSISTDVVIRAVAAHFNLKPAQLKSKNNARAISEPRQVAMYICKQLTGLSLPQIGKDFGGKHHTTVLHSIRKIEALRKQNPEIHATINKVIRSLS
jgi:chromosomal replication initiator protein